MKEGWKYKKLGDLYPIEMGKTPPRGVAKYWDTQKETSNKWVSIADISKNEGKTIYETKEYVSDEGATMIRKVPKGSLLLSFKLSLGRMAFAGDDMYTNEAIISLGIRDDMEINFLHYYLMSLDWDNLSSGNEKVKGKTLNKKTLSIIPVAYIPLSEQQRIVSYLDAAFAKIDEVKAKAKENLDHAQALFQASLTEMMTPKEGWEEKKLGEVCEIKGGKRLPQGHSLQTEPTNHKYIRVADFNDLGTVELDGIRYITDDVYEIIKRYIIKKDDIYISIAGTIGKSGIIPDELDGANLTENACRLILSKMVYQKFVYYITVSPYFVGGVS